jgi:hypothetical protein
MSYESERPRIISSSRFASLAIWFAGIERSRHPVLEMSHETTVYQATHESQFSFIDVIKQNA